MRHRVLQYRVSRRDRAWPRPSWRASVLAAVLMTFAGDAFASELFYPTVGEPVSVAYYIFDFTAFPDGLGTPFSETLVGSPHGPMTITYSSTAGDPGAFAVGPLPFIPSALVRDPNASTAALVITLTRPVYGIAVSFETFDTGAFHMDLFSRGALVATLTDETSGRLIGHIPIGDPSLYENQFDAMVLYTDPGPIHAGFFGIDQVWALENVPEPGTVGVVAAGFLALTLLGCRRPVRQR